MMQSTAESSKEYITPEKLPIGTSDWVRDILNQHKPPATSQSAVLFSRNKLAPAISHIQANTTIDMLGCEFRALVGNVVLSKLVV